jgi:hypothetical protein
VVPPFFAAKNSNLKFLTVFAERAYFYFQHASSEGLGILATPLSSP